MAPVIRCSRVGVRRDGRQILANVTWELGPGEHWVVLGPNGAGKSTFLRVAAGQMFPTAGRVDLLGETMGQVELQRMQRRIGWFSAELLRRIPLRETVADVVLTGSRAVTGRWRESFSVVESARCHELLAAWGLSGFEHRSIGSLSTGEQVRTLIARALMPAPDVLMLDEPTAGLDLAGREAFLKRMSAIADLPSVVVSHHLEEVPAHTSHALLIAGGKVFSGGPIDEVLTSSNISAVFGIELEVEHVGNRWQAQAR